MQLLVGLGNPGKEYTQTRHNIGFQVLEALANRLGLTFSENTKVHGQIARKSDLFLLKPDTFMNRSGESVRATFDYFAKNEPMEEKLSHLYVIHDDLDIPLGKYKIQKAKGPRGHNGLLSIYEHVGSEDFFHVRVGVENRGELRSNIPGHQYVLAPFTKDEEKVLNETIQAIELDLLAVLSKS